MLGHHNIGDYDGLGMWIGRWGKGMFAEFHGVTSQKLLLDRQKGNMSLVTVPKNNNFVFMFCQKRTT
jgi:hypothetical protein